MDDTVVDGGEATEGSSTGGDATQGARPAGSVTQGTEPVGTFGRYELLSLVGAGGMGQVWRARDRQTNRVVALKVLPEHSAEDEEPRERFRRECEAVAQLTEPHVIPIHDFGDMDGRLFLNMRLVDGTDLRTLIKQEGALTPTRAVAIITQVAGALQAAHDVGLVHRDVKPSNILVSDNDFAYLIDFGIAHASGDHTLTRAGETIGTAAYMAPEAIGAAVKTHARVDVYALACVLHECLTGKPPFSSDMGIQGMIAHHLHTPPPRPSASAPDVPTALDAVVAKGMAKDPDERYPTVRDLAAAARAATGATDPRRSCRQSSETQRSRKVIAILAAAVVAIAVVAVIVAVRPSPDTGAPSTSGTGAVAIPVGQGYSSQTFLPFPEIPVAAGVAVDAAGSVYVTGIGTDRVMRLEVGATAATELPFSGLKNPRDVAVDGRATSTSPTRVTTEWCGCLRARQRRSRCRSAASTIPAASPSVRTATSTSSIVATIGCCFCRRARRQRSRCRSPASTTPEALPSMPQAVSSSPTGATTECCGWRQALLWPPRCRSPVSTIPTVSPSTRTATSTSPTAVTRGSSSFGQARGRRSRCPSLA